MSPKYDKSIEVTREEEGSYHMREFEEAPRRNYSTTDYQTSVVRVPETKSSGRKSQVVAGYSSDEDNFEEWTTSQRKVNHTTRQVETRVSRQLLVEDGKVIADSGPQVTTRIKEDNRVEECNKEKTPKNKGKFDAIENAPEVGESSGRVLGEKKEIQRVSREVREENMQYHDERFKELSGHDVHRRAIHAPHELITITDKGSHSAPPKGKMVHYSNKGKKFQDTDEILEVAKLAIDGSITKEVKRTRHHEECSEDEKPDETGEAEALKDAPTVTRSSRRHVDYVNDFDDTATPSCSSDDEVKSRDKSRGNKSSSVLSASRKETRGPKLGGRRHKEDEAFPRYEIDPLLNSLRDEDFRPATSSADTHRSSKQVAHKLERKYYSSDSDDEPQRAQSSASRRSQQHHFSSSSRMRSPSNSPIRQQTVEIPEEYRVNRQRLLKGKGGSSASLPRERSFSPVQKSHTISGTRSKSGRLSSNSRRGEDAGVQAHLTDEEEERRSVSSAGLNQHERATQHLQRQSTTNSSRRYYFGDQRSKSHRNRAPSVSSTRSSSSTSLGDLKDRMRKQGVRSRDSGYKEPSHHIRRTDTPSSQNSRNNQIYSVSSKSKKNRQYVEEPDDHGQSRRVVSPTPTNASLGQRSVKTTTTTLSAGLADRPLSRQDRSTSTKVKNQTTVGRSKSPTKRQHYHSKGTQITEDRETWTSSDGTITDNYETKRVQSRTEYPPLDTSSIASLTPAATTIKVPYKQVVPYYEVKANEAEPQRQQVTRKRQREPDRLLDLLSSQPESLAKEDRNKSVKTEEKPKDVLREVSGNEKKRFDYRTIIANVRASPIPSKPQVIEAYNVRVVKHNSPFSSELEPVTSVCDLSSSIARLELLSSELSASKLIADVSTLEQNNHDNNNEPKLSLVHEKKQTIAIHDSGVRSDRDDGDRVSLVSSSSMRSSRTYDIRSSETSRDEIDLDDESHFPVETIHRVEPDVDDDKTKGDDQVQPTAWIFNPESGTSTTIKAPPKPPKPELPKVDSKELLESRGGRSYYLEVIDANKSHAESLTRQRPSSIDSLYSRSNSHSTLSGSNQTQPPAMQRKPIASSSYQLSQAPKPLRQSREIKTSASQISQRARSSSAMRQPRHQRSDLDVSSGRPRSPSSSILSKSKSSSCLAASTRPSKYSIYGGLKKPGDKSKPVPRLSYSRAIGPKSQRQLDAQPKTPSRYLKMR